MLSRTKTHVRREKSSEKSINGQWCPLSAICRLKTNSKIKENDNENNRNFNNFTNGNSGNFNDDIKIKRNSNGNFNKNNNENKDISNINFNNCKGIFIDSNYDDYFCKDF